MIVIWSGSAAIFISLFVAWWALTGTRTPRPTLSPSAPRKTMRDRGLQKPMLERLVSPLASGLGHSLLRFTPAGWASSKTKALAKAGWSSRVTAEQLLSVKLAGPALLLALLGLQFAGGAGLRTVLLMLALTVSVFVAPDLAVRAAADRRGNELTLLLPDLLDQLTISVEAGLGFESAIARMVDKHDDPLSHEFSRMLRDIRLGTSRGDALTAVADRTQARDVRTMVLTLRQADAMGVPLARSLRNLAADMRNKRRLRAEEQAHKLPVKLIFPLGLCILPAMFIVMLGPALVSFPNVL